MVINVAVSKTIGIEKLTWSRLEHAKRVIVQRQLAETGGKSLSMPTHDDVINLALDALEEELLKPTEE